MEFACSGKRCKTGFVKLSEFCDNQLYSGNTITPPSISLCNDVSDYYFLEDVSRCIDSVHRDRIHSNKEQRDSQRIAQQVDNSVTTLLVATYTLFSRCIG